MKKVISLILCSVMLMGTFCLSASALSVKSSTDELNALFLDGEYEGMDCVYYSPAKKGDTTKYPLFVWLHGNASGTEPRRQLRYRRFCNWASDEFQARFKNAGGCILFAPRSNGAAHSWSEITTAHLKRMIDAFISDHKDNIDMSRIYISGYSVGADMTWSMLLAYPDFFAAGIPCSAVSPPTAAEVSKLCDTSVWMINCDIDFWAGAMTSTIKPVFNALKKSSNRKDGVRLTSLSQAVLANGNKQGSYQEEHYTWETVTYDMHMSDHVTPYKYATTVDGNGNTISFDNPEEGVISWLSQQTNEKAPDESDGESGFKAFINKIIEFFKNLFSKLFK